MFELDDDHDDNSEYNVPYHYLYQSKVQPLQFLERRNYDF